MRSNVRLGWPCPATFIFCFVTLCLLAPRKTSCGNAYFGEQVGSKYGNWYSHLATLCALAIGLALHIFATQTCADESQGGRNSCPLLRSCFIGSFFYCLSLHFFWRIRSLVDFTLVAFIVCRPLKFLVSHINYTRRPRVGKKTSVIM